MRISLCKRILDGVVGSHGSLLGLVRFVSPGANTCASKIVSQLAMPCSRQPTTTKWAHMNYTNKAYVFSAKFSYLQRIIKWETSVVSTCRRLKLATMLKSLLLFWRYYGKASNESGSSRWALKHQAMSLDQELSTVWHSQIELSPFGRFRRQASLKSLYERKPGCERSCGIEISRATSCWADGAMERFEKIWAPGQACPFTVSKLIPLCTTLAASLFLAPVKFELTKHWYDVDSM